MAAGELLIGGWDADGAGFEVTGLQDWRNSPARSWVTESTPLRARRRVTSPEPAYESRTLVIDGKISAATSATLVSNTDDLKSRCDSDDEVTIEFGDRANKVYYARLIQFAHREVTYTEGFNTSLSNPYALCRLTFDLPDPFLYDSSTSSLNTVTTATAIPLGTAETFRDLTITINGAATNPTVTYKDSGGTTVWSVSFTASLGVSDTLVMDLDAGTITGTGAFAGNQIDKMDAGSNFPREFDPRDGVFDTSTWPTIEVSAGDLDVVYRKSWL